MKTPTNQKEFYQLFGVFKYAELPNGAILATDRKWAVNIVRASFGPRGIWVHKAVKQNIEDVWAKWLLVQTKYKVTRAESFCPRHQFWNPALPLSIHSWGAAIDVNPESNMPGKKGDMPKDLVKIFKDHGWTWGGDWKNRDPMHFQFYNGPSF